MSNLKGWWIFLLLIFCCAGKVVVEDNKDGLSEVLQDTPTVVYRVTVKTADEWGAGTDADVFIQIFGEHGNTQPMELTNSGNLFERGNVDTFEIVSNAVGSLTKVGIKRNTEGSFDAWKLAEVDVQPANLLVYKFGFNEWIEPNEWAFSYGG